MPKSCMESRRYGSFAVGKAQEQTAFHRLEAFEFEQIAGKGNIVDAVKAHHNVRFLGVGQSEHRRIPDFRLHDFARRRLCVLPGVEHIGEFEVVFGHIPEHFERHMGQDAVGAFRSHHNLIDVGSRRFGGVVVGHDFAAGRHIFLPQNDMLDLAVIGRILSRAARHRPTADRAVLKGLRKMSARIPS